MTNLLQKSAVFATQAQPYETSTGAKIISLSFISLYHKQGDTVNLNGTTQSEGVINITFRHHSNMRSVSYPEVRIYPPRCMDGGYPFIDLPG